MGADPSADEAERDRGLDAVLVGGREPVTVVVAEHDPAWAGRFATVATTVCAALGEIALAIEHIGSTSVPGLAAKPVLDVLLVVPDVEQDAAYAPALAGAGLDLRVREAGHRMFRTPARDVHVHVYQSGDEAIAAHLDLRDWLRVDAADRALYADVKRDLARRPWADMNHYADAESDVIAQILARARAWRQEAAVRGGG